MVDWLETISGDIAGFVWGIPLIVLLVGTGVYLTFRLTFYTFAQLPYALKLVFKKNLDKDAKGDISHFQALMTSLAATVGTGNVAGVATAVVVGGQGAVFWMWITALVGMATKYAEAILGVKYRGQNHRGEMAGGPMYYIEHGLGKKWKWMGMLFAFFAVFAAIFGIGNMTQANTAADIVNSTFNVPTWVTGVALTVLVGLVIIGGIKSIGRVSGVIVPVMIVFYVVAGFFVIGFNITEVPAAFGLIFYDAFTGHAVAGGAIVLSFKWVLLEAYSLTRPLGTGGIAAAAARTDVPARQALISMTQVFIDTIIVCTITGLALVIADLYTTGPDGAALTAASFEAILPAGGSLVVTITLLFFIFSTIIGWAYFGEKCLEYLVGDRVTYVYRLVFTIAVFIGATLPLNVVWNFGDIFNGLMAIPNLIAILLLSGVVVKETQKFKDKRKLETR
ncbi:LOW QUALITY PROTEIN: sodium/glycine symporter GlyP [Geomicrobium sp. JCM 19037]|nr:LOW QUALITY PROTEIN: sodium/glycine symporter GlyP [Geomicrobium sp. JCM 19037]